MRIKEGYIKTQSIDGFVVVPIEEESKNKKIMLTLNDTASEIWDMLCEEKNKDEIIAFLTEKYNVSEKQSESGVNNVISTLLEEGILEE